MKPKTKFWVPFNKSEIINIENDDKDFEVMSKESKKRIFDIPGKIKKHKFKDECDTDKLQNKLESCIPFNRKQNPLHAYIENETKIVGIESKEAIQHESRITSEKHQTTNQPL